MNSIPQDLFEAAKKARAHSYSPYSNCKVGAAVRTQSGQIFSGCNVENSSYGATICAERTAIGNAVSNLGVAAAGVIKEILVVTDVSPPWPPCGICRQVILEFGPTALVHLANLKGEVKTLQMKDLMPEAFSPAHLQR